MKVQNHRNGTTTITVSNNEVDAIRALFNLAQIAIGDIRMGKNSVCRLEDAWSVDYYSALNETADTFSNALKDGEHYPFKARTVTVDRTESGYGAGTRWAAKLNESERRRYLPTEYRLSLGFDAS